MARRKCAKRKGRASRADVAWEWQPLENGRIFSDALAVRTILEREEPSPRHRLSHVSSIAAASNAREARFILYLL